MHVMDEVHSSNAVIIGNIGLKIAPGDKKGCPKKGDIDGTRAPLRFQRGAAVPVLFPSPEPAHQRAMVECDRQQPARAHQASGGAQGIVHGSGMMQHSPGVNDVECTEPAHIFAVQDRALLDRPFSVAGEISLAQSSSAQYGILIEIERMYACAELARCERTQAAPRTNVERAQPGEAIALEQASKGNLRFGKLMRVERASKVEPVLAKPEAAVLSFGVRHADPLPHLCDKIAGETTRWQMRWPKLAET